MGKVNFKGLEKFAKQMNKLNETQINQFSEKALKELAARLLRKVKPITPLGEYDKPVVYTTKDGKQVSYIPRTGKKGGTLRRGWTVGKVVKTDGSYTIEIINPTEYASYVEFGHRTPNHQGWVEGKFMLTISEQELEADAPRILENKLKKFMGDVFNA